MRTNPLSPKSVRARRQANAAKIRLYRHRRKHGLAVFKVEVAEAEILRVLRLRGLPENHTRLEVEKKLSELLAEVAARWKERWPLT